MTAIPARPITAEEFEKFDPEWRYDLIREELRRMAPQPGEEHGELTFDPAWGLGAYVREHQPGRCYAAEPRFIIARNLDTAIGPDWAFVAAHRLPQKRGRGLVPVVPAAVLEVRSPGDRKSAVLAKVNPWLTAGVRIVWEHNPKTRTVTIHRPNAEPRQLRPEDTLSGENVLPGFSLPIRRIFQNDGHTKKKNLYPHPCR